MYSEMCHGAHTPLCQTLSKAFFEINAVMVDIFLNNYESP